MKTVIPILLAGLFGCTPHRGFAQDSTNTAVMSAQSTGTNAASPFWHAVADYQRNNYWSDGEKIARLAAQMDPLPPISEEARKHFISGQAILKQATSTNDFVNAAHEFYQANTNAPWAANIWYELAASREASHQYDYALHCIKIYQMFKLSPEDARDAQDRLYQIQAEKDLEAKHAADAQQAAVQKAQETEKALEQAVLGIWNTEPKSKYAIRIYPDSAHGQYGIVTTISSFDLGGGLTAYCSASGLQIDGRNVKFHVNVKIPQLKAPDQDQDYVLTLDENARTMAGTVSLTGLAGSATKPEIFYKLEK